MQRLFSSDVTEKSAYSGSRSLVPYLPHRNAFIQLFLCSECVLDTGLHSTSHKARESM